MTERIANFLRQAHPQRNDDPSASADLFKDAWLDSLLQLRLLNFLEKEFHIHVPAFQVSLRTFQNVGAISALVEKLQKAGPVA